MYYHQCGSQVEKILMSGRMRIAKIVKKIFIVASTVSFDPSQKLLPIRITTSIPPPYLKTRMLAKLKSEKGKDKLNDGNYEKGM